MARDEGIDCGFTKSGAIYVRDEPVATPPSAGAPPRPSATPTWATPTVCCRPERPPTSSTPPPSTAACSTPHGGDPPGSPRLAASPSPSSGGAARSTKAPRCRRSSRATADRFGTGSGPRRGAGHGGLHVQPPRDAPSDRPPRELHDRHRSPRRRGLVRHRSSRTRGLRVHGPDGRLRSAHRGRQDRLGWSGCAVPVGLRHPVVAHDERADGEAARARSSPGGSPY